jgi:hypothetical protein
MRTMKIALTAAAVLALGFTAACGKKADSAAAGDATPAASAADTSAMAPAASAADTAAATPAAADSAASTEAKK